MSKTIKVWSENMKEEYAPDQLFFRLVEIKDDVLMVIVDREGNEIEDGRLMAYDNYFRCFLLLDRCPDNIPLKTDAFGYPIVVEIDEFKHRQSLSIPTYNLVFGCNENDKHECNKKH